jgi:putative lipoprotein
MKRRIILISTGIVAVLAVALAVFVATRVYAGPATLTDRSWTLTRLVVNGRERPLSDAHPAILRFQPQKHTISGSGGCNSYGGSYSIMGGSLRFDNTYNTLMACTDATVMEQESAYTQALVKVGSYHLEGDTLALEGDDGRLLMTFHLSANAAP